MILISLTPYSALSLTRPHTVHINALHPKALGWIMAFSNHHFDQSQDHAPCPASWSSRRDKRLGFQTAERVPKGQV